MKRSTALFGLILMFCALACAQEATGGRIVVPARTGSRPVRVNVNATQSSIEVKSYNGKDVIVERGERARSRREPSPVDGLHRIDIPAGLSVEEDNNVVQIRANSSHTGKLLISVPADASLHLNSTNGSITVEGAIRGEVEASSTNGSLNLSNIAGSVVANTTNGSIHVTMDRIDPDKPLAFSTTNGSIDVSFPADAKLNLKMRSARGSIWTDFEMKMPAGQQLSGGGPLRLDRTIDATVNGGGTQARFDTVNGRISVRKK